MFCKLFLGIGFNYYNLDMPYIAHHTHLHNSRIAWRMKYKDNLPLIGSKCPGRYYICEYRHFDHSLPNQAQRTVALYPVYRYHLPQYRQNENRRDSFARKYRCIIHCLPAYRKGRPRAGNKIFRRFGTEPSICRCMIHDSKERKWRRPMADNKTPDHLGTDPIFYRCIQGLLVGPLEYLYLFDWRLAQFWFLALALFVLARSLFPVAVLFLFLDS